MAVLVSVIKSGWLHKFLNKLFFRYSAVREPPWPKKIKKINSKRCMKRTCQYEIIYILFNFRMELKAMI